MRYVCKQCHVFYDITDYDGMSKHVTETHGKDKMDDYAWKTRNIGIEDEGEIYNAK